MLILTESKFKSLQFWYLQWFLRQPSAISSRNLYPPIYFTISFLSSTPLQNDFLHRMNALFCPNPEGSELLDWGKKIFVFQDLYDPLSYVWPSNATINLRAVLEIFKRLKLKKKLQQLNSTWPLALGLIGHICIAGVSYLSLGGYF